MRSPIPLECFCGQSYTNAIDLEEHRRARGHFPSHRCGKHCNHPNRRSSSPKPATCGHCSKVCDRLSSLQDHQIATGHCFCPECNHHFQTPSALATHRTTKIHASEFTCCDCALSFTDIHALTAHMARSIHRKPAEPPKTTSLSAAHKCPACPRVFKTAASLHQHATSVKHKPLSALRCPLARSCQRKFTAPSALLQHLESGRCRSGMTREDVYAVVRACDKEGVIHRAALHSPPPDSSSPPPHEEWDLASDSESEGKSEGAYSVLTPPPSDSGDDDPPMPISYYCPLPLYPFTTTPPLQRKRFATLAALAQHLESGACAGGRDVYVRCIGVVQGWLGGWGIGGVKLLLGDV